MENPHLTAVIKFLESGFFNSGYYTNIQVILSVLTIIITGLIIKIVLFFLNKYFTRKKEKNGSIFYISILEAIHSPTSIYIFIMGFQISLLILNPIQLREALFSGSRIVVMLNTVWLLFRLSDITSDYLQIKYLDGSSKMIKTTFPLMNKVGKIIISIIFFILVVQELGYSVSSLLAGLGIGGLAVALAAKDTLSNIFGSFTIFLDKPFYIGDWIVVGSNEGIVEDVGFRTTKIRTFTRSLITIPNSIIANDKIENISRRGAQRVFMNIGVTYNSGAKKLKKAVDSVHQIIEEHPETDKESIFIYFSDFKESSLNIFVYYFVESLIWRDFLRVRQEISLSIIEAFEDIGVEFAFPSRTIYMGDKNQSSQLKKKLQQPQDIDSYGEDFYKKKTKA